MENKNTNKYKYFVGFLTGILSCLLVGSVVYAGSTFYEIIWPRLNQQTAQDAEEEILIGAGSVVSGETMQKIEAIEELIREHYYQTDVTVEQLETGVYQGMMDALEDPYADYYSMDELQATQASMEGVFYGIGAYIGYDEEREVSFISGLIEGGSAIEADLREGDIFIKVNDEDVQGYTSAQVADMVRGPENSTVRLTLFREGETDYLEFELTRKKALEKTTVVQEVLGDGIGYLGIAEFDEITVDQYTEAMAVLKENDIKGLILDLRSNPGGNVSSVTEIARKILPEGLIVYTEDRSGNREEYSCDGKNELQIPIVVLVDEYSASASEILAGAIQDYEKGTVVGVTTFGKGVVQRIHRLSDGTAVKLTVSSYFTPLGRNLGGVGIEPDIEVELDREAFYEKGEDNQLEKAIEVLQEKINQ